MNMPIHKREQTFVTGQCARMETGLSWISGGRVSQVAGNEKDHTLGKNQEKNPVWQTSTGRCRASLYRSSDWTKAITLQRSMGVMVA